MASSKPLDLEITVISAKHLKNVNWRTGDLKPYASFYLDNSDHRLATHPDDSGSTRPVWNERFTLPVTPPAHELFLTLEIFHSKPSETPKPLVGAVKFPLSQLLQSDDSLNSVYKLELIRPSGRPQGKIRVKLELKERALTLLQDYHNAPIYGHYYNHTPPPPPPPYREFSAAPYGYPDQYGYYSSYYPPQAPPQSRPLYVRASNYSLPSGPSAPVDLSSSPSSPPSYDHKLPKESNYGLPSGSSAPVDYKGNGTDLSGPMGGLSSEEGSNYGKEKVPDRESLSHRECRREH